MWWVVLSSFEKFAAAIALKTLGISLAIVAPASYVERSGLHLCQTAIGLLK